MDEDEIEILNHTQYFDGVPVDYNSSSNPFTVTKEQNIFLTDVNTPTQLSSRSVHSSLTRISLIDRVNSIIPRVSGFTTRATELRNSKNFQYSYTSREPNPVKRKVTMDEFVQQKREICRTNTAIELQQKKVEKLNRIQKARELQVNTDFDRIEDDTYSIKAAATELEAKLARTMKEAETFSRSSVETTVLIKQLENELTLLKASNMKVAEQIEQSIWHKDTLLKMSPPGTTDPFQFFKEPKQILDRLSVFELEAVSLAKEYDDLLGRYSRPTDSEKVIMRKKICEEAVKILDKTQELNTEYKEANEINEYEKTDLDIELQNLTEVVADLHEFIFGQPGRSNPPMDQLEDIYNFYRDLSLKADKAGPEARAAVIKRITAKKKEAEKQKMLAGLMKPRERVHPDVRKKGFVVKGNNRKLVKRELPLKKKVERRDNDSVAEAERLRYETLLFEPQKD